MTELNKSCQNICQWESGRIPVLFTGWTHNLHKGKCLWLLEANDFGPKTLFPVFLGTIFLAQTPWAVISLTFTSIMPEVLEFTDDLRMLRSFCNASDSGGKKMQAAGHGYHPSSTVKWHSSYRDQAILISNHKNPTTNINSITIKTPTNNIMCITIDK